MSAVSGSFGAHYGVDSEKSAISLSFKVCLSNLDSLLIDGQNSVRPIHLFASSAVIIQLSRTGGAPPGGIRQAMPAIRDRAVIEAKSAVVEVSVQVDPKSHPGVADLDRKIEEAAAAHPDFFIFESLPGAGAVLAPRWLAAFGWQRERHANAAAARGTTRRCEGWPSNGFASSFVAGKIGSLMTRVAFRTGARRETEKQLTDLLRYLFTSRMPTQVSDQRRARHAVHPIKSEETELRRKHSVRSRPVRCLSFGVIPE